MKNEGSGEVSSFYKKIKEKLELGDMDEKENNEDLKKFITSYFDTLTKHLMQGFELMTSQFGSKSVPMNSSSTPHVEGKTNGENNVLKTGPHEFNNQN